MCCLFGSRKVPACIVGTLSLLSLIAAGLMIYFSVKLNNSDLMDALGDIEDVKKFDMDNIRKLVFYGLLLFAIVVVIAAFMGLCVAWCKNRCLTVCYGCILLPTWIFVIVVGAVAVFFSQAGPEKIKDECLKVMAEVDARMNSGSSSSSGSIDLGGITGDPCDSAYNSEVEITLDIYEALKVDDNMCSSNCPCLPTKATDWTGVAKPANRCREWNFAGTLESYSECLVTPPATASPQFRAFADKLTDRSEWKTITDILKFFEDTYECAGVCDPALFPIT